MGIKLKEGDTVFDIGGNIAVTAILLMLKFPGIRLFTFEPVPESYFYLKWNATVAGVDTSLFNAYFGGLSSTGNDIFINWSPDDATAATSIDHDNRDGLPDGRVAVKTYKLDRVLQDHSLTGKQVAFVKLDCEGCEWDLVPAYPSFFANVRVLESEWHNQEVYREHIRKILPAVQKTGDILCSLQSRMDRWKVKDLKCKSDGSAVQ